MSVKGGKFAGVYDPELAAFTSATSSMDGMTMTSRDSMQRADVTAGAGIATLSATASAAGGVDFTSTQTSADFVEVLNLDDPESGLKLPLTIKAPKLSVDATGKGFRTKPLLDLLAFAVANEDEAKVKANQAELKSLLLAALPLWERIDGTYGFQDFTVESPVGTFGAAKLGVGFGSDGIGRNGTISYAIKASGLTVPQDVLPAWSAALLPTDIDLNIGGANINLDDMAKRAIEAFDLNQDPPLPDAVGAALAADFMASLPKLVIGHSTVKNGSTEIALEGEVTFPGAKPEANLTVGVAGYDKIVESLQAAAKSDPTVAQYVPAALAIKGFGKTLPDGRIEWAVNAKPDGSILVNGVMVKPADPVEHRARTGAAIAFTERAGPGSQLPHNPSAAAIFGAASRQSSSATMSSGSGGRKRAQRIVGHQVEQMRHRRPLRATEARLDGWSSTKATGRPCIAAQSGGRPALWRFRSVRSG